MRRLLYLLLILLLPLRGWIGDAMAVQMLPSMVLNPPAASAPAMTMAEHPHCATASPVSAHDDADANALHGTDAQQHPDCGVCSACQVCHSAAMTSASPLLPTLPLPSSAPVAHATSFTSAIAAPHLKPPIH